jgi:putative transposase
VKYAFIKKHRHEFKVSQMCELLKVPRSTYYGWLIRPESKHSLEDKRLSLKINQSHKASRETYGAARIKRDLAESDENVSITRINRLMRESNLRCKAKKKFKATTNSNHHHPIAQNILNRGFTVDKPNSVYTGDITYIHTDEGWLYLAVLIDLYSRAVVGWSMSDRMTANLANDALIMSLWRRRPSKGLILHSDRGSQYASTLYQKTIKDNGFICRNRKGSGLYFCTLTSVRIKESLTLF